MAKRRGNGEGSITKRKDGRWQGNATVGYNPVNGKPKKKYFYGKSRKEVQLLIAEALGKVQAGTYQEVSKLKVAEWFQIWLDEYQKMALRTTTFESYDMQARLHILPAIGHHYLCKLETCHLQALYNAKLQDGARLDGKEGGLSPRTVRYQHTIIHACLAQARKEGKIIINPADSVKLPQDNGKEHRFLDTDQVRTLLKVARESNYFAAYYLALNTGLRRGELLALRWQEIDMVESTVKVSRGLVRTKGGLIFQEPKTKFSKRVIGISPEVVSVLKAHKKEQNEHRLSLGEIYQDQDLIFCNELGLPLDPRALTRHFERLLEKAGLEKINFHGLRHTFATLSLQEGTDPRTTQEALGHHKVAFTLDVYSGVTAKMKQEATSKIGNLLASCLSQ
jgi:integrase